MAHFVNQKNATKSKVATKSIVDTYGVSINSESKGVPEYTHFALNFTSYLDLKSSNHPQESSNLGGLSKPLKRFRDDGHKFRENYKESLRNTYPILQGKISLYRSSRYLVVFPNSMEK